MVRESMAVQEELRRKKLARSRKTLRLKEDEDGEGDGWGRRWAGMLLGS